MKNPRANSMVQAIGLLLALSGCGGDTLSGETTAMAKLMPRSASTVPPPRGQQAVDVELEGLRQTGLDVAQSGCFLRSFLQGAGYFWLIVQIPVEQVPQAQKLNFTPAKDVLLVEQSEVFYELPCASM